MGAPPKTSDISVTGRCCRSGAGGPPPRQATQAPSPSPQAPSRQRTRRRSPPSRSPPPRHPRRGRGEGGASLEQAQGSLARSAALPRGGAEGVGAGEGLGVAPRRCRPLPGRRGHGGTAGLARPPQPVRAGAGPGRPRAGAQRDRPVWGGAGRRPVPDGAEFRLVQLQVSARHPPAPGRSSAAAADPRCPSATGPRPSERAPSPPAEGRSPRRWAGPPLCAGGLRCGVTRLAAACSPGSEGRVPCGCWREAEGAVPRRTRRAPRLGAACRAPGRGPAAVTPSRLNLGLLGLFSWSWHLKRCLSTSSFSHPKLGCWGGKYRNSH